MEQNTVLTDRKKSPRKLSFQSRIIKSIINAIQEKKGELIISADLRNIPEAVADFFIICQASSHVQVKAIAEHVQDKVREDCNEQPYHYEGFQTAMWVLVDYINVVVHVMQPATRQFYKLEDMWSDAPQKGHS